MPTEPSSGSRSIGAPKDIPVRSDSSSVKEVLSRRGFLGTAGLSLSLTLAGCLDSSDSSDSTDSPEGSSDASGENSTNASGSANESDRTDASEPGDVTFESTTGTELEGTIYGEGRCGVVLTPQINLDRESWSEQARRLADEGYSALAIDEDEDDRPGSILGAVRHLTEERGTERIVLVDASSGGEASVVANARAETDAVAGVVAISPGGGADRAADLRGRKLFVVAEDDERFVRTTEELHEQAPEPKELRTYSGDEHGQGLFETEHGGDLLGRILALVDAACEEG